MTRRLIAYMEDRVVGSFTPAPPSFVNFAYSEEWIKNGPGTQISLALPVLPAGQEQDATAFVAGLLPDSIKHRNQLAVEMGIEDDPSDFSFLEKMGRDIAGAMTVLPEGEALSTGNAPSVQWLENEEFADHLRHLPRRPLLFDNDEEDGVILSLAGVNDKTAVVHRKGRIGFPQNGLPSSHIVKVDIPGLENSIKTEQFCLNLAGEVGLPVPPSGLKTFEDQTFMLMARYDRSLRDRKLKRVHQEDFCQALGILPGKKYQRHGGPGWPESFELVMESSNPLEDRRLLLDYAFFQFFSGNPDAHAKNYSLIYRGGPGSVRLAPIYDLNNAAAHRHNFKKTNSIMAMSIGKQFNPDRVTEEDWRQFAKDCGFSGDVILDEVSSFAQRVIDALPAALSQNITCEEVQVAHDDIMDRCLAWAPKKPANDPGIYPA